MPALLKRGWPTQRDSEARGTGWRAALFVFAVALAARLLLGWLIRDTYDYDEFVVLLLGRDYAHGWVPYSGFMFFHPPGILVALRVLQPLVSAWWPSARILSSLLDSCTAVLVWAVGRNLYGDRTSVAAGLLYAISPVALISGVRVGQDPIITFLGVAGLALLVLKRGWYSAVFAGVLLGIAVWVKYPAVYFAPVYLIAAPRRGLASVVAAAGSLCLLIAPFHEQWSQLYFQTVTFQRS